MENHLTAIRQLRERQTSEQQALVTLVCRARYDGASWPAIGAALGVSRQAAIARYGPATVGWLPFIEDELPIDL